MQGMVHDTAAQVMANKLLPFRSLVPIDLAETIFTPLRRLEAPKSDLNLV